MYMLTMTIQVGLVFVALAGLSSALICPDGGMCEERNTCCQKLSGGYGCCPLPNAECCADHHHCCYEGTVCDIVHHQCLNKTVALPWVTRLPATQPHLVPQDWVKAVICPDHESECPDDTTCCQLPDGAWGCCPLAKAVCCEDKRHCCPEGTKCDVAHSKCLTATLEGLPLLEKMPARKRNTKPAVRTPVMCPGGESTCPDGSTCCLLISGEYGCCPFPEAVCCNDHIHCCPGKTTCDLVHGVCRSRKTQVPLFKKIPALPNDVACPDKKSSCPDETTCCQMASGEYGCCPMPDAVCCSDHMHCCPTGTQCDLEHSTCVSANGEVGMATKVPAVVAVPVATQSRVHAVPCNESVACADGNTCCKTTQGEWGCCPLPQAVCCEDHLHCCPHGTICNLAASMCEGSPGDVVMPLQAQVAAFSLVTDADNSKCDESSSCPGKTTCCKTTSGSWACCPLPQAVCCNDRVHCCPHGTVCNLEAETCDNPRGSSLSLPWVEKIAALDPQRHNEKCDKQTVCPGGSTCCKLSSGQWACCPLPKAVCCEDHEHCCPRGYRCNVTTQTCDKPGTSLSLPWIHKMPALTTAPPTGVGAALRPAKNMCDAHTSCPRGTTCCFMDKAGKWGCCPLEQAVCCSDGDHCCPSGHTCDPHRSSCSKGPHSIPWFTKQSATSLPDRLGDVKCDDKSSCASGTTCCKLPTGDWGCCPLIKAVCCEDHEHCCPQGYSCNMKSGTCEKQAEGPFMHTLPQSTLVQSKQREAEEDVPCDSTGEFRCSKQDTCCKTSTTGWACCPSPKAVCCADSVHCCPAGFACNQEASGCTQQPLTWDTFFRDRKRNFFPFGL